ncbi:hypothetical protein HD806DRAFT_54904 [Xylariaceae sp. AK1471]|nr:hypothetical protein HD806DRAFT_54904 [Xylariaceae sp. AK1471]
MAPDKRTEAGDIYCRSPAESSPDASDSNQRNSRSKANIRVSLACVQCRSKHVKCDATQPACGRCLQEGKPCYYAKSRRGIRDPKKRSLIPDRPPIPPPQHICAATKCVPVISPFDIKNSLSNGWTRPQMSVNTVDTNGSLLDSFFEHFYHGHPILPPKRYFLKYVELDPNPYQFLLSVIDFCGALYAREARLTYLREAAYSTACGPLPFTVQSIQGLHLLAIVAFGETKFSHHLGFANRARTMAIELCMHRKSFADRASDPVLAESYRRTWWYVKFLSVIRRISEVEPTVDIDIDDVESDVDIPCSEEWEYQSGQIPLPISHLQYKREAILSRSDFPSIALQVEICQIQTNIVSSCSEVNHEDEERAERNNRTDSTICDFLRRVPRWKMDIVDPDGRPDQVLFGAVAWAHISRIKIRQSSLRKGLNIREYFPLGPTQGPNRKGQAVKQFGWNPHPVDIQAANSFCDLFLYRFPIKSLQPMMIPGLLRVAIVYLDACVFLGLDSPVFRERINALIQILREHGETWPLSKNISEDIQAVANDYLDAREYSSSQSSSSDSDAWNGTVADAMSSAPFLGFSTGGFDTYSDLNLVQGWLATDNWPDLLNTYQL